ncbi:DUF1293 family protein [Vibrio genomosp. F6]|uniref:Uncharacterized protein n=1 Tax=Vibrio genomosp. F6 str. FF-238 TaxID=1191298 RepID=A0A1E5CM78_9VIBR|nr:DUF1293 family protein [Vibrio genomosp. F6]OEE69460.1 hypothetical protein A130_09240 [Vibrio genomosp. F6 str. FF-238]
MSTATAFFVHGIKHTIFKNSGNASASIYVGRALKDFSNDNMEIKAAGYFDSIEEFEKNRFKHLAIEEVYAEKVINSRAFVPYQQYELRTAPMPDNPMQSHVVEIIPVDAEVKKHFMESMKQAPNKA